MASVSSALRPTAHCLREHRRPPTRQDLMDLDAQHAETLDRSSPLDINLFEDPSGGLSANSTEEMTSAELESQLRILASAYVPELFYLLYTPLIDLVGLLVRHKLIETTSHTSAAGRANASKTTEAAATRASAAGEERTRTNPMTASTSPDNKANRPDEDVRPATRRAEDELSRWFTDGATTLREPHFTEHAMGPTRWAAFVAALRAHYVPLEEVMPLTGVVRQHGLCEALLLPVLRQLAMDLAERRKRPATVAILPGFVLALANGRAPPALRLPNEKPRERVHIVSELLMGVAQETGNTDLAFLGLQLLRANHITPPFARQKQLTNVFSSAARIETDWRMRVTGLLVEALPHWLLYYKQVSKDNAAALAKLKKEEEAEEEAAEVKNEKENKSTAALSCTQTAITGSDDGSSSCTNAGNEEEMYFGSRRSDAVARTAALERNIVAALNTRGPILQKQSTSDAMNKSNNNISSDGEGGTGRRRRRGLSRLAQTHTAPPSASTARARTSTGHVKASVASSRSSTHLNSSVTLGGGGGRRSVKRRDEKALHREARQTGGQEKTQDMLGDVFEL